MTVLVLDLRPTLRRLLQPPLQIDPRQAAALELLKQRQDERLQRLTDLHVTRHRYHRSFAHTHDDYLTQSAATSSSPQSVIGSVQPSTRWPLRTQFSPQS